MKTSMTLTFTPLLLSVVAAHMSDPRPLAPPGDETVNTLPSIDDPLTPENYYSDDAGAEIRS